VGTQGNAKSKSEKFPPPHQDGALVGFPLGSSRFADAGFDLRSGPVEEEGADETARSATKKLPPGRDNRFRKTRGGSLQIG